MAEITKDFKLTIVLDEEEARILTKFLGKFSKNDYEEKTGCADGPVVLFDLWDSLDDTIKGRKP